MHAKETEARATIRNNMLDLFALQEDLQAQLNAVNEQLSHNLKALDKGEIWKLKGMPAEVFDNLPDIDERDTWYLKGYEFDPEYL